MGAATRVAAEPGEIGETVTAAAPPGAACSSATEGWDGFRGMAARGPV